MPAATGKCTNCKRTMRLFKADACHKCFTASEVIRGKRIFAPFNPARSRVERTGLPVKTKAPRYTGLKISDSGYSDAYGNRATRLEETVKIEWPAWLESTCTTKDQGTAISPRNTGKNSTRTRSRAA